MSSAMGHLAPGEGTEEDLITWRVPPGSCPSFALDTTMALRRHGVRGERVVVVLLKDAIGLLGNEGRDSMIPLARVVGLRVGVLHVQRRDEPQLRLFLRDPAETFLLRPLPDASDAVAKGFGYAGFVRGLAARLAACGRQDGIATGSGWGWAILSCAVAGGMAATMITVCLVTMLSPEQGGDRWIAPLVTGGLAIWLSWLAFRWWAAHWPRRIRRMADLERGLPRP
ncbi:hypothetical protein GXW78_17680 [Roseomonas terrae]|jgi:hypothetical protein|uniref:TPM domain-containing protein n=1 Tax=Neoroseomonas terrae TaxID=424799 RepID=A0ABS5EKF1_9PROT|nr:hypothetical protein [Neoroseomonas terrae]MBR0651505.1 hypothetical protein [Neoroseomonas terrae]